SLTIDAAGNWTYTLNNADPAVQVLKEGESIVRPITVTSADGTTHVITVTIQGTNETATLGSGTVQEDTTLTADGTLVATGVATFVP
ncbi:VCBS domain-containing protein, partial [Chitiniphilus shinanonensis]